MTAALPFDPPGGDNFDTERGVPDDFLGYVTFLYRNVLHVLQPKSNLIEKNSYFKDRVISSVLKIFKSMLKQVIQISNAYI